jgi:hypothetical protein
VRAAALFCSYIYFYPIYVSCDFHFPLQLFHNPSQACPNEQGRRRQFSQQSRHDSHSNYWPARSQVSFAFKCCSGCTFPRVSCNSDMLFSRSVAITETCSEAGVDMDGVASPAMRTAPHQEGVTYLRALSETTVVLIPCSDCRRIASKRQISRHSQQALFLRHVLQRPRSVRFSARSILFPASQPFPSTATSVSLKSA